MPEAVLKLKIEGTDEAITSLGDLKKAARALEQQLDEAMRTGSDGAKAIQDELAKAAAVLDAAKATRQAKVDQVISLGVQFANASVNLAKAVVAMYDAQDQARINQIEKQAQRERDAISETDKKIAESTQHSAQLERNLADATVPQRNKVLHAMEAEQKKRQALMKQKDAEVKHEQQLEAQKKKLQLDQFNRNKTLREVEVGINTAAAVIKALAEVPFPLDLAESAFALGVGIAQEAAIAAEKPNFDKGGYTGAGLGYKDSTGNVVAGNVHAKEWVAPESMAYSPQYGPLIAHLDEARKRGGAPGPGGIGGIGGGGEELAGHFDALNGNLQAIADRPVIVDVREVSAAQERTRYTVGRATV